MKSKGIAFGFDKHLEGIPFENLKEIDQIVKGIPFDRALTSQEPPEAETPLPACTSHTQHTFTRTAQLHKDGR